MTIPHLANLAVHIGAGVVAMGIGAYQLARTKGDPQHRRAGRWFLAATFVVTGSALVGTVAFRFIPLFAVLTLLVTYIAVSGWRVALTRERGPQPVDLAWTAAAIAVAAALVPVLMRAPRTGSSNPAVVLSTLSALGLMLGYDLLRWTFPRRWFARIWLPEHIYKIVSALFGMVSAFVGNVVRWGQPWSQIAPSVVGLLVVLYWWSRVIRPRAHAQDSSNPAPVLSGK